MTATAGSEHRDTDASKGLGAGDFLALGVGCRQGTSAEEIEALAIRALADVGVDWAHVSVVATLDRRLQEPGILAIVQRAGARLVGYSAAELAAVSDPPTPSDAVRQVAGTPSVCEAAAVLASEGGTIIVSKRRSANATVALARREPGATRT